MLGPGGAVPREKGAKRQFSKRQMLREAEELLVHVKPRKSNHLNAWLGMEARKSRKKEQGIRCRRIFIWCHEAMCSMLHTGGCGIPPGPSLLFWYIYFKHSF